MNKKGAVLHWIVFFILGAFGLFFVFTADIGIKGLEGNWQLNFLENYYLEAEEDLLEIDQAAKFAGWQAVLELGEKGGFAGESECGVVEGYNLWNDLEGFCSEDVGGVISTMIKEELAESFRDYSEVKLEGKDLIGKGEKESIVSFDKYVKYTYDTSFRVDLGFDVGENYEKLLLEAIELVGSCREVEDLEECIEENKGDDWKLKDCDKEEFSETGRKVLFCVESGMEVFGGEGLVPVRYKFALDFTEETD